MRARIVGGLAVVGAFLASLLATKEASAQYYRGGGEPDGVRFRGGVGLEGGAFIAPGIASLGAIGVQGQLGVQINNNWAVYGVPSLDILFGGLTGVGVGFAAMADYTFNGLPIAVGAGVEGGDFVVFSTATAVNGVATGVTAAAGGGYYGARLHFAYYPIMNRSDFNPIRRRALFLGFDLHLDGNGWGAGGTCVATLNGGGCSSGGFLLSPMISVGYVAF